jgi:hypothetical protein
MKQGKNTWGRRRVTAVIAGITGVAAVTVGAVLCVSAAVDGTPQATGIPAYAPANSDTLVVAPYTENWWAKITAMAPRDFMLDQITPDHELRIAHIGYSRSQDTVERPVPGPLRVFFIEATDAGEAGRIATWLKSAPGYDHRAIHVSGNVIAITAPWIKDYNPPSQSMASEPQFKTALTDKKASMWFSPVREAASLTGTGNPEKTKALETYVEKGMGFSADTAWSGTSSDGQSWSGTFTVGGVDPARVNFTDASAALMSQRKVLATIDAKPGQNTKSTYQVSDPGLSAVLATATVSVPSAGSLGANTMPLNVPSVQDAKMTAVQNLTTLTRAATGDPGDSESVISRSMSANGTEMVLSFTYAPTQEK